MIDVREWAGRPDVARLLQSRVDVAFAALREPNPRVPDPAGAVYVFDTHWLVSDLVRLHGNLVLAHRHPQNRGEAATVALAWVENLEVFFARLGLAPPPGGWRGA